MNYTTPTTRPERRAEYRSHGKCREGAWLVTPYLKYQADR